MSPCPRCRRPVEETDCYCRYCGKPLLPGMGFWYDHGGILLLTLLAGPFSLITVWLSHKLSLRAKWYWTAGIMLFSAYVIYTLYHSFLLMQEAFLYFLPAGL